MNPTPTAAPLAPTIIQKPSPNEYTQRGHYAVIGITIHAMQGFLSGTDQEFASSKSECSSNYGVGIKPPAATPDSPYGEIHQYVDENHVAWAVGLPENCINKAFAGKVGVGAPINPNYPKWPLYIEGSDPNYYVLSIENEGFGCVTTYGTTVFQPTKFTPYQHEANAWLVARAAKRWGFPIDSLHVVPHGEIYTAKMGKCPGGLCSVPEIIYRALQMAASPEEYGL